jgi:hypothetical protein
MAKAQQMITQSGTREAPITPPVTSAAVMTASSFCASFVPWLQLKAAAGNS